MSESFISRADVEAAARRIDGHVRETPVLALEPGAFGLEARLVLKLELLQHTGSFKPRGAFNRLLSATVPPAGVLAASGGNHGAAVAYAARRLGHRAEIFVPTIASAVKVERLRRYGAQVTVVGADYAEALAASRARAAETGALVVHAYDQPEVVAGQGTVARELARQAPDLETVLVAVGGGGLIGGIAAWYGPALESSGRGARAAGGGDRDASYGGAEAGHAHAGKSAARRGPRGEAGAEAGAGAGGDRRVRIVGVEPERAPTLARALEAGAPVDVEVGGIAADSLGARRVGALAFALARRYVERVVLVPDGAIREAQRALWEAARVVAEPGGAAALAALLSGAYRPAPGERVGVLVCGGNTDPAQVA